MLKEYAEKHVYLYVKCPLNCETKMKTEMI
jgi:hypothetical protein